jgi:hypothetical protein
MSELNELINEPIHLKITCATDNELEHMLENESYTTYYKSLVLAEINKRDLKKYIAFVTSNQKEE